ncbi:MAG TPA: formate/nitrite transporter family protein [Candidatus Udaeobacter sp.]|jgi:formate/nitrite transporter FocA (FNT family)
MPVDKKRVKDKQEDEIIDRTAPPGEVIYEAVYAEGEHELDRNSLELAFSGLAAGLSMGFSMMTEGILRNHLPDATWQPLITKLGYSVGFLVVILGRQQLFTKNTLTVILPLLREKKIEIFFNVARLWAIVLIGNLIGAFVFAWLAGNSNIFSPEVRDTFSKIGQSSMQADFGTIVIRAAVSGWLIALMVWLLPFAESARLWVIIILAYVVGIAELPHVVAGTVESFYLVSTGALGFWHSLGSYVLPAFIGNVIGGVALVAVGAHAEFFEAEEVSE